MKPLFFASLCLCSSASAAIVYSGIHDIPIPTDSEGVYLDLDSGTASVTFGDVPGWDFNATFGGFTLYNSASFQPARSGTDDLDPIVALTFGDTVDATRNFASADGASDGHMDTVGGTFPPGGERYLGFQFTPDGGLSPFYGWMRVTFTVNQPGGILNDWAWDDSGAAITAGAVPEPSALLLSALSLPALLRRRR